MENQQMAMPAAMPATMPPQGMPQEMSAPGPDQMAIYEQMRQQISPQEFSNEMFAGASQADPGEVAALMQELESVDISPEDLDAINDVVDEILANPEAYQEIRQKYLAQDIPEEVLPEEFDAGFFAALNMAVDQMIAAPTGVQSFAKGGIAELKPIAKVIASYGRNGDTMLAHITPAEARMLRRRGGSGTTNPVTGLPEFFGRRLRRALRRVGKAVKKFASSSVGKLITTVALGFFLGPAAASFLGASSAAGVAAVSGFVGSAGATALGGGSLKDSLKAGVTGAVTAGVTAGITGGADAFKAGSASTAGLTPGQALQKQADTFKSAIGLGPAAPAQLAPVPGTGVEINPIPESGPNLSQTGRGILDQPAPAAIPGAGAPATATATAPAAVSGAGAARPVPTIGESFSKIGQGQFKEGLSDLFAPSGASTAQLNATASELVAKNPAMSFDAALKQATRDLTPGLLRTYAPAVVAGLGATAALGGFDVKPVPESQLAKDLKESATDRMKREGTQRLNYIQNLPGVVYDQFGAPVPGGAAPSPFPIYTPPGMGDAKSSFVMGLPGAGLGGIGNTMQPPSQGFQPYNNADAYSNLMAPGRKLAQGGIAALAKGGYSRRTGQISGPGTEKSDSIPAMLSDGEFVMTAAAVRGAGKGSRRAGAKQMYKLMHQLEKNSQRG